jgi:hypothetical protein
LGITGTQNLHYTDSTDAVEDHSTNLEVLARQLDARMRAHDLDIDRAGENRPFCVLDITLPPVVAVNTATTNYVPFDTVQADTAGMADLDANPYAMSFVSPGYYQVGLYATAPTTGCVAGTGAIVWQINQNSLFSITVYGENHMQMTDGGNGWVAVSGSNLAKVDDITEQWGWMTALVTGTNCPAILTVSYARIWAYKVRDL